MKDSIIQIIKQSIDDAEVYVDSSDGTHFQAIVISPAFDGLMLVKQHQMVMNALKAQFDTNELHALQLKTFTPENWEQNKHQFNIPG